MKLSAVNNTYNSINFGRALTPDELAAASKTITDARSAMGFDEGKGVLILPSERIPNADGTETFVEKVKDFFKGVKNLLGINAVNVTGDMDEGTKALVRGAMDAEGLKAFEQFNFDGQAEELAAAVKKAAGKTDGLWVSDAQKYSPEQLDIIEKTFKKVKGELFDPKMIVYDVDNGAVFDWGSTTIADKFKGRTIVGSSNAVNDNGGVLWGSTSFFTDRMGAKQGEFIHGIRRQGEAALDEVMKSKDQVYMAEHLLKHELALHDDELLDPARFAAAKRADVAMSESFYKHFDDVIPGTQTDILGFEKAYHEALQKGLGDNYLDSLEKAVRARGLDAENPEIYANLRKFRNALYAAGPVTAQKASELNSSQIESSYENVKNVVLTVRNSAEQSEKMTLLDKSIPDKIINFCRKNKNSIGTAAGIALLALIGGTMFAYGKETASKEKNAQPKSEKTLDKKA